MATPVELTSVCERFMLGPRAGPGVCRTCFNFTRGYDRCYACAHGESWLDAVAPISYSVDDGHLHHMLVGYKRAKGDVARDVAVELAAVLSRFLEVHETCVARAASTGDFELVTTVPSADRTRAQNHPLAWIVGERVVPTRTRHERLLRRSTLELPARTFHTRKYERARDLDGESVLLIDDTWTTGSNAQSAAAALKSAGAGAVGIVVIGRHLNRGWHETARRLRGISRPFEWDRCALCSAPAQGGGR